MRILLLIRVSEGGEWIASRRLFEALVKRYHFQIDLVAMTDRVGLQLSNGWKDVALLSKSRHLGHFSFLKNMRNDFSLWYEALSEKSLPYDAIVSTEYLGTLALILIQKFKHTKKYFYFHGRKSDSLLTWRDVNYRLLIVKILELFAWSKSSQIITPSEMASNYIKKRLAFWKLQAPSIAVIPNIVSDEFFNNFTETELEKYRKQWGISRRKSWLYVGRIDHRKGLYKLIHSCKQTNCTLIVAYPTNNIEDEDLLVVLRLLSQNDSVVLLPDLSERELAILYRLVNVLVLLSEIEFSPLVVLEAMASRCLCITNGCGNTKEMLGCINANHFIVNSNEELLAELQWIMSLTRNERNKLGVLLRRKASQHSVLKVSKQAYSLLSL